MKEMIWQVLFSLSGKKMLFCPVIIESMEENE